MSQNSPSVASENELAALYLRDRDVDCPSCGYNRRDGNSSSCPECGCAIALQAVSRESPIDAQRAIRCGLLFLVLYATGYVMANTASLITILVDGTIPATLFSGAFFFGGHIFWLFALYWTIRLWSKSRKGMVLNICHFSRPALAYVVMTFIGVAFHIYAAVLSLMSVI